MWMKINNKNKRNGIWLRLELESISFFKTKLYYSVYWLKYKLILLLLGLLSYHHVSQLLECSLSKMVTIVSWVSHSDKRYCWNMIITNSWCGVLKSFELWDFLCGHTICNLQSCFVFLGITLPTPTAQVSCLSSKITVHSTLCEPTREVWLFSPLLRQILFLNILQPYLGYSRILLMFS